MERDDLKQLLKEVLHDHRSIDDDRHATHHQYIESELVRREHQRIMWDKFRLSFIGGLALVVIGFLGWMGQLVLDSLQRHTGQ